VSTRTLRLLSVASIAAAAFVAVGVAAPRDASAQERDRGAGEDRGGDEDGARFRGGIRGQGSVIVFPDPGEAFPAVGVEGHIGAQINDLIGVYWAPGLDIIFGSSSGMNLSSAIMVDFTLEDTFQIGVGPDTSAVVAFSSSSAGAAALYGGRLHFAYFPVVGDGEDPVRRKGLALGVDVRLLTGGSAFVSGAGASASGNTFVLHPMAFVGYEAF
jgi:hypothetical protein